MISLHNCREDYIDFLYEVGLNERFVKNRERVYILSGDKSYEGTIAFHYDDKVNFVVFLREQFVAGGMSGAPIISAQTGTVVAILIGADKANNPVHINVEKLTIE